MRVSYLRIIYLLRSLQVRSDYLQKKFESGLDLETAVSLCCLEIRRMFRDMPATALDKKANFECLERDVGLTKFLPNVSSTQTLICGLLK